MSVPNTFPDATFPFEYWVLEYWPISYVAPVGVDVHGCIDLNDLLYSDVTIEDSFVSTTVILTDELIYSEVIIVDEKVNEATITDSAYYDTTMESMVCPS